MLAVTWSCVVTQWSVFAAIAAGTALLTYTSVTRYLISKVVTFSAFWTDWMSVYSHQICLGTTAVKYLADIEMQSDTVTADWVLIQLLAEAVTTH